MTLGNEIILPLPRDFNVGEDLTNVEDYLHELIYTLQNMYSDISFNVNGTYQSEVSDGNLVWIPVLKDTANSGTTFTYTQQYGYVYRQGLMTDVYFDIGWSANTGAITGNMYIDLPYKVALTSGYPFVGTAQPSVFTFTGGTGCVISAISDTYRAEIWNVGDAFTTANQGSVAAGEIKGFIRYIGQENE